MSRGAYLFPQAFLEKKADIIHAHPERYVGYTLRFSSSSLSVKGRKIVAMCRELFPQGFRALGWLSHVGAVLKPLTALSSQELTHAGFRYIPEFPRSKFERESVYALQGHEVMYIDLVAAYWTTLGIIWRAVFGADFPCSTELPRRKRDPLNAPPEHVDKRVRNMAWGRMASRIMVEHVDPPGKIRPELRAKVPPPVYYAVPWHVNRLLRRVSAGERGVMIWVDSVICPHEVGTRIVSRLVDEGWECHVIEGTLAIRETLDIVSPDGEVLKSQAWAWLRKPKKKIPIIIDVPEF